ncbi:hypothetical protein AKO1_007330 [Acrasis kona]|uniref:Protein phosphatase n=1 Tax=Acrasis kona TaxID=1008807 RepID=A0AAW2YTA4_9EUKA
MTKVQYVGRPKPIIIRGVRNSKQIKRRIFKKASKVVSSEVTKTSTIQSSVAFASKKNKNVLKRPDGRDNCGEDAYFLNSNPKSNNNLVFACGIADGVGGCTLAGIDPSLIAWRIMECSKEISNSGVVDPVDIMNTAYSKIKKEKEIFGGATTAIVSTITKERGKFILRCGSLGDSSIIVVRDGRIVLRSKEQTHFWNCPFQLSYHDKDGEGDTPNDSSVYTLTLEKKDIILLSTDGLTDNLFDRDILSLVTTCSDYSKDPTKTISTLLVDKAYKKSRTPNATTPFSQNAPVGLLSARQGGKPDDITVVAMRVV